MRGRGGRMGRDGGQQFLHNLPVLNHPTWEVRRGAEEEVEETERFFFGKKKKKKNLLQEHLSGCTQCCSS